mmetsp:Transcript_29186/g.54097  ORF Transcript_29186/g.54097 Transcript_29186/m.54097 type:complete len:734 (+) Transcript_29186:389-2590(+)
MAQDEGGRVRQRQVGPIVRIGEEGSGTHQRDDARREGTGVEQGRYQVRGLEDQSVRRRRGHQSGFGRFRGGGEGDVLGRRSRLRPGGGRGGWRGRPHGRGRGRGRRGRRWRIGRHEEASTVGPDPSPRRLRVEARIAQVRRRSRFGRQDGVLALVGAHAGRGPGAPVRLSSDDRPPVGGRVLLRQLHGFEGRVPRGRLQAHRGRGVQDRQEEAKIRAYGRDQGRGPVPLRRQSVQGADHQDEDSRRDSHDRVQVRRPHRPVPRSARCAHGKGQGLRGHATLGDELVGRYRQRQPAADVRDQLSGQEDAQGLEGESGEGQGARPPPHRREAGAHHVPRPLRRLGLLAPPRRPDLQQAHRLHQIALLEARVRRSHHSQRLQPRPLAQVRTRDALQGRHVLLRRRGGRVGHEADELPGTLSHVRRADTVVPRPAAPVRGLWRPAPERTERRIVGPDARPAIPAGRRAHLLQRGSDRGRGEGSAGLHEVRVHDVRDDVQAGAVHEAQEGAGGEGAVGPGRGGAGPGHGRVRREGRVEAEPRRRGVLRAEDRHQGHGRHGARSSVRDGAAGLSASHPVRIAVQYRVEGEGGGVRPAHHRPSSHARERRADVRGIVRALRRQVAVVAVAPAGHAHPRPPGVVRVLRDGPGPTSRRGLLRRRRPVQGDVPEEGTERAGRAVQLPARGREGRGRERDRECPHEGERGGGREEGGRDDRNAEATASGVQVRDGRIYTGSSSK